MTTLQLHCKIAKTQSTSRSQQDFVMFANFGPSLTNPVSDLLEYLRIRIMDSCIAKIGTLTANRFQIFVHNHLMFTYLLTTTELHKLGGNTFDWV